MSDTSPAPRATVGDSADVLAVIITDGDGVGGWSIEVTQRDLSCHAHVLSADERARCDAMAASGAAGLRRAAHVLKRQVVGAHLGQAPEAVAFAPGDGRPVLAPPHHATHVSLSHTAGAVAVAVAERPVGVDIETIARTHDAVRLAARYFAPAEARLIGEVADAQFEFAWRWTAKEALLKACGLSLTDALATSLGDDARPREAAPFTLRAREAHITVFTPAPGYVSSVARG